MIRKFLLGIVVFLLGAWACAPRGYTRAEVIYAEPAEYVYVVPVDRVVVVSRDVLVSYGWVVFRIEHAGPRRVIWARRGDEVTRIFVTPDRERVVVRGLVEHRDRGKHKGLVRRGPPRDIIAAIDVRLRAH